jgi:hypothetical protein
MACTYLITLSQTDAYGSNPNPNEFEMMCVYNLNHVNQLASNRARTRLYSESKNPRLMATCSANAVKLSVGPRRV